MEMELKDIGIISDLGAGGDQKANDMLRSSVIPDSNGLRALWESRSRLGSFEFGS